METTPQKLHKASGEAGIRLYFEAIVRLEREQQEKFPIDLDTVWELAYDRKDHAVRALTDVFIKGTDFQHFPQKGEKHSDGRGMRPVEKYYLTVPAMEWFVARRVPAVFAVYREVFHQAAKKALPQPNPMHGYLAGMIGAPLTINKVPYWPYTQVMATAGYKGRPQRLYSLAQANMDKQVLFPDTTDGMFVQEYGRIWARAEVFSALEKRRNAWLALSEAQKEVREIFN